MILEIKALLAAKLILVDNYVVALELYQKNAALRRQVNLDTVDPEAKFFLEEVTEALRDQDTYERIVRRYTISPDHVAALALENDDSFRSDFSVRRGRHQWSTLGFPNIRRFVGCRRSGRINWFGQEGRLLIRIHTPDGEKQRGDHRT